MRGSAIYRIGYERWSRNIAVALGNAPPAPEVRTSLLARRAGRLGDAARTYRLGAGAAAAVKRMLSASPAGCR